MDQAWVLEKEAQRAKEIELAKETVRQKIIDAGLQEYYDAIMDGVDKTIELGVGFFCGASRFFEAVSKKVGDDNKAYSAAIEKYRTFVNSIRDDFEELWRLQFSFERFADSEPVEFDGDIIITDPCYILRDDTHDDDWGNTNCGEDMDEIGIQHFMTRDTIYGDWSCSVYDTDIEEKIGEFCADSGMVSVILLDEVLQYNPSFDHHVNRKWTTALIKDFKGTVLFVVREVHYEYDGEDHVDYEVEVVGHGVNKKTGKPLNFVSKQSGL